MGSEGCVRRVSSEVVFSGLQPLISNLCHSRLRFDCRFSLQLTPTYDRAADGGLHRLRHHVIHDLSIAEALKEQPPEQTPAFFAFQREREARGAPVNRKEKR